MITLHDASAGLKWFASAVRFAMVEGGYRPH
jgi:hypothetical protein